MTARTFFVKREEAGMKLLAFLSHHCPDAPSIKALKRSIDGKQCRVNGQICTISTTVLQRGDRVQFESKQAEKLPAQVLFEEDDFLVINKPANVVCEASSINKLFPQYAGRLRLVHRLDKETSGVLLLAKNERGKDRMVALWRKQGVKKVYRALVDGVVKDASGICRSRLAKKTGHSGKAVWGSVKGQGGVEALSHWKRLKIGYKSSYMELEPITGRTHQLRVHMSEMGHAILGDVQYRNKKFSCYYQPRRTLLHAFSLEFVHPTAGKKVRLEAPVPADMNAALQKLFK